MNRLFCLAAMGVALLPCLASPQVVIGGGTTHGTTYTMGNASASVMPGQGYQVNLNVQDSSFGVTLPSGTNWNSATHVLFTVKNVGASPALFFVGIDSGSGANTGWLWSTTVVPVGQTVTLAMPLQPVTGLGIQSWPSLPDTSMTQIVSHGNIIKSDCRRIVLANNDPQGAVSYQLVGVNAVTLAQNITSFIDQYGQQSISFPGKVTNDSQLLFQATQDALLSGSYPFSNDAYGGVAGTATASATGKWSVAKQNGRWYIIDPSGNRFFSAGIVGAGWSTCSYTQDRLSFFQAGALPPQGGSFAEHYHSYVSPFTGAATLGYDFYSSNLERKFGPNWTQVASQSIAQRMRTWGFNTLGPLSTLIGQPDFASAPVISIAGNYSKITTQDGHQLPDVYDPAWATVTRSILTAEIAKLQGNLMNMGVFVDNELPWAQVSPVANSRYLLPFSVLSAPWAQASKKRFVNNLTLQYRTIAKLNSAWGTNYSTWTALQNTSSFRPNTVNATMAKDLNAFTSQFATLYFSTIKTKLTSLNYKGLYLGCRFLYYTADVLAAAKRYSDVVSFNAYETGPNRYRADLKSVDCPVMISEVGFGASDLGRVSGYSPNIVTESDRVQVYQNYMSEAMTWNNLVGIHWYKWEDDPTSGRMWDNQVASMGLVSITDNPYPGMAAAVQQVNSFIHNRLLTP